MYKKFEISLEVQNQYDQIFYVEITKSLYVQTYYATSKALTCEPSAIKWLVMFSEHVM